MTKDERLEALLFIGHAMADALTEQGKEGERLSREWQAACAALFDAEVTAPPSPARQQCACAIPDPVMQADRRFYCHTCSFQVPAVLCERCQSIVQPSPAQEGGDLGPCRCGLATCPDRLLWLRFLRSFALSDHLVDASEALREYAKQAGLPMPPVDEDDPKSAWIAWIKSRGVRSGIYWDATGAER